jgi:peptidyl-prolyl cis-trans isomerase C
MKSLAYSMRILTCLAIFSVVFTFGCRKKTSPEEPDVNQVEAQSSVRMLADGVAATVNGVDIKESEVRELMKEGLEELSANASQLSPNFIEQYRKRFREQVLEQLIVKRLLAEKVEESDIKVTNEEIINLITKMLSAQAEPLSFEEYKQKLVENGRNFEEEKERIREGLAYQKILEAQIGGKINITEDDAKKFYDENPKQFETAEQIRVSHILIKPVYIKGGDPNEAKALADKKAKDLLQKIKNGADFAVLAKASSACPSAPKGGDLGFISKGDTTPVFEETAFKLEVGQVSDIVKTEYGYHIIKVTDHKDASIISFDEAKDRIIEQLKQSKQLELRNEYIESLKAEADIVYASGDQT